MGGGTGDGDNVSMFLGTAPPRLSVQRFGTAELLRCVEGDPGSLGAEGGEMRGGLGGR